MNPPIDTGEREKRCIGHTVSVVTISANWDQASEKRFYIVHLDFCDFLGKHLLVN